MRIFNKDFIIDLQKTILWQYDKAQNLRSLINQKQSWYKRNVTDFILNFFKNIFNLKTATDFGLSVWGRILNFPRQIFLNKYQIEAEQTVGIDLTDIEVARVTFNSKIGSGDDFTATTIEIGDLKTFIFTYDGSNWDITGSVSASDVDISDYGVTFEGTPAEDDQITIIADYEAVNLTTEQYRFLLLGQILKFNMSCTLPEINRYLRLIFDQENNDNVYVTDNHNMTITYTIQPPVLSSDIQKLVNNYDFLPTPAGVKILTSTSTLYTLTINTTPADAEVVIYANGTSYNQKIIEVEEDTIVNYQVTKSGYATQIGTITITNNTTIDINLDYIGGVLQFSVQENNTQIGFVVSGRGDYYNPNIQYSVNASAWQNWNGSTLTLQSGSTLYVKGNNPNGLSLSSYYYLQFTITGRVALSGNLMDLLLNNEGSSQDYLTIPNDYCFYRLFKDCLGLYSVNLTIPTNLTKECFYQMFSNDTNLTQVSGFNNLTVLPDFSCRQMFEYCTNLTNTINLSNIETFGQSCCAFMYSHCSNLNTITGHTIGTENATLSNSCCSHMFEYAGDVGFNGVTLNPLNLAGDCYGYMFSHSAITIAPYIKALVLADGCFTSMYEYCDELFEIKIAYTGSFLSSTYFYYWVEGVPTSNNSIFYYNGNDTTRGVSAIPENWIIRTF